MADDTELLEQLAKALRAGAVEPPPAHVQAVRRLVDHQRPVLRSVSTNVGHPGTVRPSSTVRHSYEPLPTPRWAWADRRLTMVFSGVAATALLAIAIVAALHIVPGSSPARSEALLHAQNAAYRVQVALDSKNPAEVAKADAELLRTAETVRGPERDEVQRIAVPLHVQAIAFLRDHASAEVLADVPGAVSSGGSEASSAPPDPNPPSPLDSLPTLIAPDGTVTPIGPIELPPVVEGPTTTAAGATVTPSVRITAIRPRLNGNFEVQFAVSGFTPDASGAPDTYTVRFSYDGGADATTYTGDSPWSLPLFEAILHRQVCAEVVDAAGAVVPDSGNCTNIINL
ncbi:MAG TPA: hypothetical protein VM121_07635 [Acidimicrobiales bacterium]|nr:hypothetical protein [Acidimicrobiales bacterium]